MLSRTTDQDVVCRGLVWFAFLAALLAMLSGCGNRTDGQPAAGAPAAAGGGGAPGGGPGGGRNGPPSVDVVVAGTGSLRQPLEYTGTTRPLREVSVRSRVEGRLLNLNVNVGDAVRQGQELARLDDSLLRTAVNQAQAELAARQSDVAAAQVQVTEARTRVEQARLDLRQRQADAERYRRLADAGALARQQAELAETNALGAAQVVQSAETQVRAQQQAVQAAEARLDAQRAVLAQQREQVSFTALRSPTNGVVVDRVSVPGNLVRPGDEVLRLGDFSRVEVLVQVSELELTRVRPGIGATVRLDAFPDRTFPGQVSRISPAADPVTGLAPVTVTISNPTGRIGGGLLARVQFAQQNEQRVMVPESAVQSSEETGAEAVFVLAEDGETVAARGVRTGGRADGQVEILSGLEPGTRVVARSSRPLNDGEPVRLSILSAQPEGARGADGGRPTSNR